MKRVFIVLLALSMMFCSACREPDIEETTHKYLNTTWLCKDKNILLHFEDVCFATGTMIINGYERSITVYFVRRYRMDVYDTALMDKVREHDSWGDDVALLFSGDFKLTSDDLTVENIVMQRDVLPKGTDRLIFTREDDGVSLNPN